MLFVVSILHLQLYCLSFPSGFFECNLSEASRAQQCFGAVGQPLIFNLPNAANKDIRLIKDNHKIFEIKNNQIVYNNESGIFINQTFKLINVTKRHSGDYEMEGWHSNGTLLKKVKVRLEIQGR